MLLKLETYLKRPNVKIDSLSNVNQESSDYFVKIDDEVSIEDIIDDIDRNYLEGVIHFEYNGTVIMDFTYWDIVDQLWTYTLNLIEDSIQYNEAEVYFPDQPIKMKMKAINGNLILFALEHSTSKTQLTIPRQELFAALLESSEYFFKKIQKYFLGEVNYGHQIERINKLKDLI